MSASGETLPGNDAGFWTIPDHIGEDYYALIGRLHRHLQPKTYLEIGVLNGDTLAIAECPSIGIDPNLVINQDVIGGKRCCLLFQMTSDAFFSEYDPKMLLGAPIEMAFVDGSHLFEYVLRDFMNLERSMKKNAILLLDECIPTDAHVCRRRLDDQSLAGKSSHPDWWAGDAWKAVVALRNSRPDLRIHAFNAVPNGLVVITNLNPASNMRADQYFDMVGQYANMNLREYGVDKYLKEMNIQDTRALTSFEDISERFWL